MRAHRRLTLLLASAAGAGARAQPAPAVGFRVVHEVDHARTTGPRVDFAGVPRGGPRGQPVQIGLWYPARGGGRAMTLGDHLYLSHTRHGPRPLTAADSGATRDALLGYAQPSRLAATVRRKRDSLRASRR